MKDKPKTPKAPDINKNMNKRETRKILIKQMQYSIKDKELVSYLKVGVSARKAKLYFGLDGTLFSKCKRKKQEYRNRTD